MLRLTETTTGLIMLAVPIVMMTCCGVLSGIEGEWAGMGLCFFLVVYIAEFFVVLLLNHKIESRFKRLAELVTGKSQWDLFEAKFVPRILPILVGIFFAVMLFLSILACHSRRWLALCVLLAILLIIKSVSAALTVLVVVKACSKRLEELFSENRGGLQPSFRPK